MMQEDNPDGFAAVLINSICVSVVSCVAFILFPLRKHAYSNNLKIYKKKKEKKKYKGKFSDKKNMIIFYMFAQNIDCGYPLEPPHQGGSFVRLF